MNKREQQRLETLEEILRVSHELFTSKGFNRTTIQEIAKACSLSNGALYHHFRSKEEVLEEICRRQFNEVNGLFQPIMENDQLDAIGKIRVFMEISRANTMNTGVYSYSEGNDNIENAYMNAILKEYSRRFYVETIAPLLEQARLSGEMDFKGSGEAIALFLHSLDSCVYEQINDILRTTEMGELIGKIDSCLDGFVHTQARILGLTFSKVSELIQIDVLRDGLIALIGSSDFRNTVTKTQKEN